MNPDDALWMPGSSAHYIVDHLRQAMAERMIHSSSSFCTTLELINSSDVMPGKD